MADVVLCREAFYASALKGRLRPHYAYWPVNFCLAWHDRQSALFQTGGLVAGNQESAYRQPAQRHKESASDNSFLLAVELLFTLAVACVSTSGQGARML